MDTLWEDLRKHQAELKGLHLRELLKDEKRNQALTAHYQSIHFDYTHERIVEETVDKYLAALVDKTKLRDKIQGLFNGQHINNTENRAVLHTALRAPKQSQLHGNSPAMQTILNDVHTVLDNIKTFSEAVRSKKWTGATNKSLSNLIVIGIGGSYLSIEFVYEALRSHPKYQKLAEGRKIKFLANVDPIDFSRAVEGLNVEETLVLVNSKTFTTAETILNAKSCKQWLLAQYAKLGVNDETQIAQKHICACSTNLDETGKFGINPNNVFGFWNFVGGRFSVWSAVGILPLAIHFGYSTMQQFLSGGHSIDKHLLIEKHLKNNIPLLLGLLGFYRTSIEGYTSRAIIPYCQALCKFAPHVQQLDMESNGKRVTRSGQILQYQTAVINFGEPGTNGQHSFFQLLHQGRTTPVEFIGFTRSQFPYAVAHQSVNNHDQLMSNFFSQPDALAIGKTRAEWQLEKMEEGLLSHNEFPGDRPSSSLLFVGELDSYRCGQLLAIYQHRTSIEGFIWDVNSYDQFGVQLGKILAKGVRDILKQGQPGLHKSHINTGTKHLLGIYLANK